VSSLFIGLLGAVVATNQPAAFSNLLVNTTGVVIAAPASTNDTVRQELQKIMDDDDAAEEEVDVWIRENQKFALQGGGIPQAEMRERILKRFETVRHAYEDFIRRHPDNADARLAFASFLHDMGEEESEVLHLEKARELNPTNTAALNQLANYHGHRGSLTNAFVYYEKAIELDPTEPVYPWNLATTVYLFRKDAMAHYGITEQQVFDKALDLYAKALKLDPTNFGLATDLAISYYGIRPVRTDDALNAWTNAMKIASDVVEREGVHIHFARLKLNAGRFDEARGHLNAVTNTVYDELKGRLVRSLREKEKLATETNSPPATSTNAAAADASPDPSPAHEE
jgi:tetratricopeptide (TPR) repeat protein